MFHLFAFALLHTTFKLLALTLLHGTCEITVEHETLVREGDDKRDDEDDDGNCRAIAVVIDVLP